jgi:hypothetical protein
MESCLPRCRDATIHQILTRSLAGLQGVKDSTDIRGTERRLPVRKARLHLQFLHSRPHLSSHDSPVRPFKAESVNTQKTRPTGLPSNYCTVPSFLFFPLCREQTLTRQSCRCQTPHASNEAWRPSPPFLTLTLRSYVGLLVC